MRSNGLPGLHCLSDQTIQPYAKQVLAVRFRNGHFARDAGTPSLNSGDLA
jgi:hypothetical protein